MKRSWLAAAVIGLAACSELPALERGVCGNRVVEPGEDCDGAAAAGTCAGEGDNACFFVCEPTSPVSGCPDGYRCGLDERCRLPAGEFAASVEAPTVRFDVDDFRVGDVDGDGVGDVMGGNARTIRVRFGGPGLELGDELDVATRLPTGPFDFTRFDDNTTMDAVVPVGVGVFSLVADGADLVPVAYSSIPFPSGQRLRLAAVEVMADIDSELLVVDDRSLGFLHATGPRMPLPADFTADDLVGSLAIGDLHALRSGSAPGSPDACPGTAETDAAQEIALAFGRHDRVYVASTGGCDQVLVQANSLAVTALREVRVPDGTTIGAGGAYFGRFDADQCLDLLISTVGPCIAGTCDQLALASGIPVTASQCSGALPAQARTIYVASGGRTFQPFRPIAVGNFDRATDPHGIDDVVLADRVVQTRCGSCASPASIYDFGFLAIAAAPWASALVTDINRDGNPDIAARVDGADDVDLLLGSGIGPFNRYQIDTAAPVTTIATGDFDGDLFLDVAIAERGAAGAGDVVSVAFGSSAGGPSAPVAMGTFGEIAALAPLSSVGDVESIDVATDLVVVADRRSELGDSRAAAVLLGDTSRRMVAPFLLRVPADRVPDVPRAVVAGSLDAETGVDLAVIAAPGTVLDAGSEELRPPRLWLLRGDASGEIVDASKRELGADLAIGDFDPLDALYAVGELDGELPNEIVGIDRRAAELPLPDQISRLLIVRATAIDATEVVDLPALGGVRSVRLADLDADGDVDLYAAFGAVANPDRPPRLLVIWNQGGALDVAGADEIAVPELACADVAPIQADADAALELAVLCRQGPLSSLVIADLDAAGAYVARSGRLGLGVEKADNVEVGDVDGDTIDDVLVHTADGGLRVVRQCAVGEIGCTAEGGIQ